MNPIVSFAVGVKATDNAWQTLAEHALQVFGTVGNEVGQVEEAFTNLEADYKQHYDDPIPSTYRSAKSVILKALKNNVGLRGPDGFIKGKSAIEKECKALSPAVEPIVINKYEAALFAFSTFAVKAAAISLATERAALKSFVNTWMTNYDS